MATRRCSRPPERWRGSGHPRVARGAAKDARPLMRDRRSEPDPALVDGHAPARIGVPVVDLLTAPRGRRDRQLIFGEGVRVLSHVEDRAYIIADKDGYVGFVPQAALARPTAPTHKVISLATHVYEAANIKSPDQMTLSFGSYIAAIDDTPKFVETVQGFIPKVHLAPADQQHEDTVSVAQLFLGAPYLWGGNSRLGLDCSGLIQTALLACGIPCPGDSDQQEAALGEALPLGTPFQRGDLLFWRGHVALLLDDRTMIHANAHHMAVSYEDAVEAIERIARKGDGPVTSHRRLR